MTDHADTFGRSIEGSRGTLVFGNGIDGMTCDVEDVGADYIRVTTQSGAFGRDVPRTVHVPLSAVVYFRFEDPRPPDVL
jgi:hypothetical protein